MPENESYRTKLLRFWAPDGATALWLLFGLVPLFFFQTVVHEGIHWLATEIKGGDPTLIPFAHFNSRLGGNVNGATLDTLGFIAMPQIVGLLLLVVLSLVFIFASPPWRWLRLFLTWWYLGLALDIVFNTIRSLTGGLPDRTDWGKFANEEGDGVATFLALVILLAVLSHLGWIAVSRWHINRPPPLTFSEFRDVAAFFGGLSLVAVIASLVMDHPTVDRNWWFWLAWTGQLVALGGFVTYIVWTTRGQSTT